LWFIFLVLGRFFTEFLTLQSSWGNTAPVYAVDRAGYCEGTAASA